MKKTPIFLLIIAVAMIIPMTGCDSDDNLEFTEYTNPMANNPANTIDWLITAKQDAKDWFNESKDREDAIKNDNNVIWGAYIKLYTYQEQDYYEVRYGGLDVKSELKLGILNFQCEIYDSQGNVCYSIVGGDSGGPRPGYEHLSGFWGIATFKSLLWEYKTTN